MSILDHWSGETVERNGRRYFVMPDGKLQPVIAGGGAQGWEELIDVLTVDGTAVSATATETIVCPDFNLPAYYLAPGRVLRLSAFGVMTNTTSPGTLVMRVRYGNTGTVSAAVQLLATGAQVLDTVAHTSALWSLSAVIGIRAAGATGKAMSSGLWTHFNNTGAALPALMGSAGNPGTSGNAEVTIDTTIAKLLSISAQFSAATNSLTCQQRLIEVLN